MIIGGRGIHGRDPWEQGREAGSNDGEELTTMQRVERVANVDGSVNPAGVGLEEGSDGVGKERQASTEVRPTWIGHGEPSGWRGGREESAEVGGWR